VVFLFFLVPISTSTRFLKAPVLYRQYIPCSKS
jgi:hypothetical protein